MKRVVGRAAGPRDEDGARYFDTPFEPDLVVSLDEPLPAVPCGVFGDGVVLVVPLVVPDVSEPPMPDEPVPPDMPPDVPPVAPVPVAVEPVPVPPLSPPVDVVDDGLAIDELPVDDVLDGLDIELSVLGWSDLLQAPSAATVAMIATHWIERCMCAPRLIG